MIDNTVKIIKHKVRRLNLADELGNASKVCKVMGLSRDTFTDINQLLSLVGANHYLIKHVENLIIRTELKSLLN